MLWLFNSLLVWLGIAKATTVLAKPNFPNGFQVNGSDYTADEANAALGGGVVSVTGITAGTTQTQGGATALTGTYNNVTTCATAGDSVKLPAAVAGLRCVVRNSGGSGSLAIFPATGDAIDSLPANASISILNGTVVTFFAINGTTWYSTVNRVQGNGIDAGYNGSGGQIGIYATTTDKGRVEITTADNTGNTVTGVRFAAQAAARTYGVPDWSTSASADTEASLAGIKVVTDTTNRPGALGCLLYATGNNKLYVCTGASATAATWTVVGTQS